MDREYGDDDGGGGPFCFPLLSVLVTEEREQSTGDQLGLRQIAQVEDLFSFVAPFSRHRDHCGTEAR
jgi:hypothetical protein